MNTSKDQSKLLLFLAVITIFSILLLCINTYYWADDYNFINSLNSKGIFQHCLDGYQNWDGRMLSLGAFVQAYFLKNLPIAIITLIWSLCFLSSGIVFYYIIHQEFQFNSTNKYYKFLIISVLVVVFWLGAFMHFSETIYWGTGGFYSFVLLLGALWVLGFLRIQKVKISFLHKLLFLFYSIVVGGSTQNLTIALLTLVFIYLVYYRLKKLKSINNFNFLILLFLLSGFIFIMLAPGNAIRMEEAGVHDLSKITIIMIVKNLVFVFAHYLYYSILAIFLTVLGTYGIFCLLNPTMKFDKVKKINFPNTKESFANFLLDIKWLLLALSTILPFFIIPNLIAKRTVIFFVFFLMLFACSFCYHLFQKSFKNEKGQLDKHGFFRSNFSFLFILISALFFAFYNFNKGIVLKQNITEREHLLEKSKGKTVYLKLINQDLTSPCYRFSDFFINVPDKDNFIKSGQELYYGVKIVVVE